MVIAFQQNILNYFFPIVIDCYSLGSIFWPKKPKNYMAPFMDGVQLPQGYGHFREAVYFLPFISQQFLLLILLTSSGFEHGTPGLGIQCLNH